MNLPIILFLLFFLILPPQRVQAEIISNYSLTSDYVFRGKSRTGHNPAVQGGFDWEGKMGINAGTWLSNVSSGVEQNFYLNYKKNLGLYGFFLGHMLYYYPLPRTLPKNHESSVGLFYRWLDLTVHYSHDYYNSQTRAFYFDLKLDFDLPQGFLLLLSLGQTIFDDEKKAGETDYNDISVALGKEYEDLAVQMTYSNTDRKIIQGNSEMDPHDRTVYFSISKVFN